MSGETQPVAWRVKDSSGGWMICSETAAKLLIERNSALIEPLYSADALASRDAEIERLRGELAEARGWAEGWRSAVDTACTLLGLNNGLGASEFTVRVQRLSVALGEAERAIYREAVSGQLSSDEPVNTALASLSPAKDEEKGQ